MLNLYSLTIVSHHVGLPNMLHASSQTERETERTQRERKTTQRERELKKRELSKRATILCNIIPCK